MKNEQYDYFICFRGNSRMGGVIAEKIYDSLTNKYGLNGYFSSASDREYQNNYRAQEMDAIDKADTFIMIFSLDFFDNLHENDEVLFELRYALQKKNLRLIAVAEKDFVWNEERKTVLKKYFDSQFFETLVYLDYITYYGVREYADGTEKSVIISLGLKEKQIFKTKELVSAILTLQKKEIDRFNNASGIGYELVRIKKNFEMKPHFLINGKKVDGSLYVTVKNCIQLDTPLSLCVIGEAGSGKSTLLQNTYEQLQLEYAVGDRWVPIYLNLHNEKNFVCEREGAIRSAMIKNGLEYSDENIKSLLDEHKFIFIFDGLDERLPDLRTEDMSNIVYQRSNKDIYMFSCRKSFFQNIRNSSFDYVVELLPYSPQEVEQYGKKIMELREKADHVCIGKICNYIRGKRFFCNILFLTIFLLFVDLDSVKFDKDSANDYDILSFIVQNILKREKEKQKFSMSIDEAFNILVKFADCTYFAKCNGQRADFETSLCVTATAFAGLEKKEINRVLEIFVSNDNLTGGYCFAHELFSEFLLAKQFVEQLYGGAPLEHVFSNGYSIETNSLITSAFEFNGRKKALEMLIKQYDKVASTEYVTRLQVLNHMHRTLLYGEIKIFAAERAEKEVDEVVKILLLHTLLAVGDETDEERYYSYLKEKEEHALLNSGITLLYYANNTRNIRLPYYDDGAYDWYPIFIGYKKHIQNARKFPHYRRVLRINLFTAKKLIDVRQFVDTEVADFFAKLENRLMPNDTEFGKKVWEEYRALMNTVEKYMVSDD